MKSTKILYWVFTVLFGGFMIFSGVDNLMVTKGSIDLIAGQLKFPEYMIPFLGVAKILGGITILVPGFPRLKEWAYAGLFFDLAGATYAGFVNSGAAALGMLMFIIPGGLSYFFYHKRLKETGKA